MARSPRRPIDDEAASLEAEVPDIQVRESTFYIVGKRPLIFNRMAAKAMRQLLLPKPRSRKSADLELSVKHDPLQEYRDSVHRRRDTDPGPTRLLLPAPAFKGAMATGALDAPGLKKTEIGRRVWVNDVTVPVWGKPYLFMSAVRNSGINKTPDIRTRALLKEWAAVITVSYIHPLVRINQVVTLLGYGGITAGVGDFRQEKGKGNYGQFEFVDPAAAKFDPAAAKFVQICAEGGTEVQDAALADPETHDEDSQELLDWYTKEVARRSSAKEIAPAKRRGGNGEAEAAGTA
jgi:hypothetical protein